ncbi:hypothetical protein [Actinomycetospora atypica]|uniref:Uncharacterized protein n=1 Tax=Actinomycetospora atypica TaxID=1290095 RepID=A0ABV9YH42_9PSEU
MSDDPSRAPRTVAIGLEPAIGEAIRIATQRLVEQTARSAQTCLDVEQLVACHGKQSHEQLAGFLFELMSADAFNRQAIALGERARASVTAFLGSPHAAADIRIVGASGAVREVQAKLYQNAARAAARMAAPTYRGLDRLVPYNQYQCAEAFYDDRLARGLNPLRVSEHADARAHLTDRLRMDGVESAPIPYGEVHRAAQDPRRWANRALAVNAGRQIAAATLTGAAIGAVFSGVVEAVQHIGPVQTGEMSVADAARAVVGSALAAGVRSGAVAGVGASLQFAVTRGGVAASVVGRVPAGAVAGAVVGIAESALAFARGDIGVSEFALRACESTFASGASWAGGAFGQAVIPIPLVGALVGGLVGQWCSTIVTDAIRGSVAREDLDPERTPGPLVDPSAVVDPPPGEVLVGKVTREDLDTGAESWPFDDANEFEAWLADPDAVLLLDANVFAGSSTARP